MTLERKFGSLSIRFFYSWHKVKRMFFRSCVSRRGTNFEAMCLMFKPMVKISWQELQLTPVASEIPSILYRQSLLIFSRIFSVFSLVRLVDGRPEWGWPSMLISPLLNCANHSKTCGWLSSSSLKAFWSISCASVAVFLRQKQNLKQIRCSVQSDITILREELDNTSENWQHKPVQPSMVMSAWLLTREGCNYIHLVGEHWTTIRKSFLKPVPFFLGGGLPSYVTNHHITEDVQQNGASCISVTFQETVIWELKTKN